MIQSFREKLSGVIAIALIILIAIPLAFFGVDSLFLSSNRIADVAEVNGKNITELELERAVVARRNQIAQMLGENFSPDMISDQQLRQTAINDLITQKLYLAEAGDLDIGVSDRFLASQLLSIPQFTLDGQFSDALFRNYLGQMGYTSASFMESFSDELTIQQLTGALVGTGLSTDISVAELIAVAQETRSYQTIEIPVDSVLEGVQVTAEEIASYYQQNGQDFQRAEQVSVDYVSLSRDMFLGSVEASAEEVTERFDMLQASQPTQREVAHILVEPKDDDSHLATLDSLQARLEAGESFDALAEELSDDIGSSANGGYLGFSSGDTFPFEFEQALLELDVDAFSAPVQTEAGFHIIKLLAVQSTPLNIEEEYTGLELRVKQEKAEELYVEALEEFNEAAFSTSDLDQLIESMAPYAELVIDSSLPFERNQGVGIATNAQVRGVAFGPIVLEDKLNSEVIELSDTRAVVIHLNEYFQAGIAPLGRVREQITETLRIEKATGLLADQAEMLVAELQEGADLEELARREDLEWQVKLDERRGAGGSVGDQIFALELDSGLPQAGSFVQPEGGYIVYRLDSVEAGSINGVAPAEMRQLRSQLSRQVSNAEFDAYTATLREEADISVAIDDVDIEI